MKFTFVKIFFCFSLISCHTSNNREVEELYGQFPNPKSSVIIYLSQTNHIELTQCTAETRDDSIFFRLTDSLSGYELNVLKVNNYLSAELNQQFSITDSSYKKPVFAVIEQTLKLSKDSLVKGDELKGFLNLKVSVLHRGEELSLDTISIAGLIYAPLK